MFGLAQSVILFYFKIQKNKDRHNFIGPGCAHSMQDRGPYWFQISTAAWRD